MDNAVAGPWFTTPGSRYQASEMGGSIQWFGFMHCIFVQVWYCRTLGLWWLSQLGSSPYESYLRLPTSDLHADGRGPRHEPEGRSKGGAEPGLRSVCRSRRSCGPAPFSRSTRAAPARCPRSSASRRARRQGSVLSLQATANLNPAPLCLGPLRIQLAGCAPVTSPPWACESHRAHPSVPPGPTSAHPSMHARRAESDSIRPAACPALYPTDPASHTSCR